MLFWLYCFEFDKMQILEQDRQKSVLIYAVLSGDNRSLRFCAMALVVALLIFRYKEEKMKKTSLLALLFMLCLCLLAFVACDVDGGNKTNGETNNGSAENNGQNLESYYTISQGLVYISNGDGTCYVRGFVDNLDTVIVIPPISPNGDRVTGIDNKAFSFHGCESLVSVMIPDSVTSIGTGAFSGCKNLASVTIPNSVTSIGDKAFFDCESLASVTISDSVTSIGYRVFYGCKSLKSITIPNGVTSIGSGAFAYCKDLTSITIPDSVTSIGNEAFSSCMSINEVYISDIVAWCNISFDQFNSIPFDNNYYEKCNLYLNDEIVTDLVIPEGVSKIGSYAFYGFDSLTSIMIPNSVISIGECAFSDCSSLEKITVSDNNTKYHSDGNCLIETDTKVLVSGCKKSIIPTDGSVTAIGDRAFDHCILESITIPDSITSIGEGAFWSCWDLKNITIPDSVTSIGSNAFYNCDSFTRITIPDSVTSIGYSAFSDCSSLTDVMFETPEGWWYSSDADATNGTSISSSDLAHNVKALRCLTIIYEDYYWKRSE